MASRHGEEAGVRGISRHPTRRNILRWGAGAGLATLGSARSGAASLRRGGVITLLLTAEPPTLTTIAHSAYNAVIVSPKVTEGLLTYDFDLNPQPQLATTWRVSEDGLTYTFGLRRGVTWHDGRPFTSADVAFSLWAIKEIHPRGRSTFGNLVGIRMPDEHTVVLILSKPAPYLLTAFAASETPIVPRHVFDGAKIEEHPALNAPTGTGPFVFKEWERGSHVAYERNPNYWDQPKPYIDRLIIRFVPDPAARSAALEAGDVQVAPNTPVPLSDIERLKALPHLAGELRGYEYTNSISRVEFNLDRPFFRDVRVRRAFAHVIDRNVIRDVVNYGYGMAIPGPISASLTKFYYAGLKTWPSDRAQAERLLDEAGYPRKADGVRVRLTHDYVPSGDGYRRGAEYIRQALAKVGVEVSVRGQDFATYTKRVYADRDFDFTYNGMSNLFDPTVGVQRLYWSKNFKPGVPFSNGAHYVNPEVDRLLETAAVEVDPARRYEQFVAFQKILVEDLPDIGIVSAPEFTIYDRRVAGHTAGADGVSGNLAGIHYIA
jgi:peptide/nickel transport system substrate-binding protein